MHTSVLPAWTRPKGSLPPRVSHIQAAHANSAIRAVAASVPQLALADWELMLHAGWSRDGGGRYIRAHHTPLGATTSRIITHPRNPRMLIPLHLGSRRARRRHAPSPSTLTLTLTLTSVLDDNLHPSTAFNSGAGNVYLHAIAALNGPT